MSGASPGALAEQALSAGEPKSHCRASVTDGIVAKAFTRGAGGNVIRRGYRTDRHFSSVMRKGASRRSSGRAGTMGRMKMLFAALVLALSVPGATRSLADDSDAAQKDLAAIQGEWALVSGVADGFALPDQMVHGSTRVCKGDQVTATVGGQVVLKAKVTLDPTKTPKTIDYDATDGPTKGQMHLGIYTLEGDTFRSCFGAPGAERPTDFTSKPGDRRTSTVWKRKAAQEKPGEK
jgi:uncharacterized protein (TIGR03067 family)